MKPIPEMTDAELNEAMAVEVMGGGDNYATIYAIEHYKQWNPTSDLNQAWECEERLNELGLTEKYLFEMKKRVVFGLQPIVSRNSVDWCIAHATARQRCEAVLMAVRGERWVAREV